MMDLHGPYLPPKAHLTSGYRSSHFTSYFELLAQLVDGSLDLEQDHFAVENARQRYEGELRFADQEVGRFVEHLRRTGRWEETLVWILSDHGEAFGEHEWVGHSGNNVFSTLLHVPMILKPPRSFGLQRAIVEPVQHQNLGPGQKSGVEFERWIFRSRTDQNDCSVLNIR